MIQDQLVDYVSSQMKLGVSREAIKSALVSAGWVAVDVDDTLKKVEGGTSPVAAPASAASPMAKPMQVQPVSQPTTQPTSVATVSSMAASATAAKVTSSASTMSVNGIKPAPTMANPQTVRVSDLISSSPAKSPMSSPLTSSPMSGSGSMSSSKMTADIGKIDPAKMVGKISGNTFEAMPQKGTGASGKGSKVGMMIAIVLAIIFAAAAGYFYSANAGLASKVASLTSDSNSVTGQLATLQSQVTSSSGAFANQIAGLTAANNDLALELSFYAAPLNSTSTTPVSAMITGSVLAGGKAIVTPRGARIFISVATNASVAAQLKTLVGDSVEVSGMYVPGSDQITANSVTNLSPAPVVTSTSSASSTSSSTSK